MEKIKIEHFTFTYPQETNAALSDICVSVNTGEFIVLLGPSGSGKTTLLSQLKKEIRPAGESFGEITVNADYVGYVGQNPHNQIVCDKVWHELAFGLENMGIKPLDIRAKVSEMATFFGIEKWFDRDTQKLSGGQKQILNLASVMVMDPDVLILDEPLSQLDPIAATDFLAMVKRINEELGTTIILSEHRLEEALQLADSVWMMDGGALDVCSPKEIGEKIPFSYLPVPAKVFKSLDSGAVPLTIKEGRAWLATQSINIINKERTQEHHDAIAVKINGLYARYGENGINVLNGVTAEIKSGEIFGILGGNGSGKSTLLSVLCGIKKPYMGSVKVKGACAMLPQNCENLFVYKTVYEDLKEITKDEETIKEYARLCGIEHLLYRHPGDLSGGESERAALCKVLLTDSDVVLLDEPTKGMDAEFKQDFEQILKTLTEQKKTVVMVSHDVEFCALVCDRCALLFNGEFTSVDKTCEFFSKKAFYTTSANRMARGLADELILPEELIKALGAKTPEKEKTEKKCTAVQTQQPIAKQKKRASINKYTALSYIGLLIAIPLTLLFGVYVLEDKKYYLMSLMVICEALVAFAVSFEKEKNKSRKIVMIATLSAIAVAGRFIFTPFPEVKPVLAIIILAGATLGAEAGFLTGAVTAFVSNMFAGQGAWTPWQMFAMGVVGMVSALIFKKIKPTKITLSIYGIVSSIAIYGLIMNPASLIMWNPEPTFDMFISTVIAGIPYDAVLGVSTAVFLWLLSGIFMDTIGRIKTKYDI
ncbi:MAG: ATP-binding cassette domain-containing protein [Clostridia bacterium]|nr:ATP-binding cassette domain-containing protein [Clostridia bacterium]